MITSLGKQGGRRYGQMGDAIGAVRFLRSVGPDDAVPAAQPTVVTRRHSEGAMFGFPRVFRRYRQHTDAILPISHEVTDYLDAAGVTLTTAVAANIDQGLSVTAQAQTTSGWSAMLSATQAKTYTFELWLTFSDGSRDVLEFWLDVVNP